MTDCYTEIFIKTRMGDTEIAGRTTRFVGAQSVIKDHLATILQTEITVTKQITSLINQ